jgi:GT2 family glycosyltransferase
MALIAMAVYDTDENGRTEFTEQTLYSLFNSDLDINDTVVVVDNGSCKETKKVLSAYERNGTIDMLITLPENIGTARAINKAWVLRGSGENCVKMDNDVVIHDGLWVRKLEQAIARDPSIGIIGLKRKDLGENPWREDMFRSELRMLPHEPGLPWIIVEKAMHIMGTCTMFSSALLDKIGYLEQPGLYGFDDTIACLRSQIAGFYNCFLPEIEIDHIDPGGTDYTKWKQDYAGEMFAEYHRMAKEYVDGKNVYYGGE